MSSTLPQHCPTPRELDDLELLTIGAFAPLRGFNEPDSIVTLDLPVDVLEQAGGAAELVDPEGLPLARVRSDGSVEPLAHAEYGPFRRLHLTPQQVRDAYAGSVFVPVRGPLTRDQLAQLRDERGRVVFLALNGDGTPEGLSPAGLARATLAAAALLDDASVVVVPLAKHLSFELDRELGLRVVGNYAGPDRVVEPAADPGGEHPAEVEVILRRERPHRKDQGLVLFFTGLSGSGKSTLARALVDQLLEHGERTVTSLDGDVVRRNLSAGLTFSWEDREKNVRRIGWVAAEISRHGGVAVCSPIAPSDVTRKEVRQLVEEAGGAFFLVHVATPLEECERRDRKGLYAMARRGEIPDFTGISSPYDVPMDASVRLDTTDRTVEDALGDVIEALRKEGYVDLPPVG